MFIGEYKATIDGKNRVIIPAKLREELGSKFVITRGLDGCLAVYPWAAWEAVKEKLAGLPESSSEARYYYRYFSRHAVECESDSQGRVTVPQGLREYAQIEKDLMITGVFKRIEIWSRERYLMEEDSGLSIEAIAAKMAEFGI